MKKLTRKLFLSVAALAVCAATLVSTTFAWYVSNSTAGVSGAKGSTAAAGSEGNLLVAQAKDNANGTEAGAFMQNITLVDGNVVKPTNGLIPVTTTDVTAFTDKDGQPVTQTNGAYIEFKIWVLSTKETSVTMEVTIANTTEDLTTKQTCYNPTGAPVAQGETFKVDAVKALRVAVSQDDAEYKIYNADVIGKEYATPEGLISSGTDVDAQEYYKALIGSYPAGGKTVADPTTTQAEFQTVTVTANTASLLTFRVWLEGTDSWCFDSCSAQDFSFDFAFSVNAGE